MKIIMLGTGNAAAQKCYNTCFIIKDKEKLLLVDCGGGSAIIRRLKKAEVSPFDIHDIFVTHRHADHVLGIFWVLRAVFMGMKDEKYKGDLNIYGHDEVIALIESTAKMMYPDETEKFAGRVHFITVHDGEEREIIGRKFTFFDIKSTKAKQFGFNMELDNKKKLTCMGDEPCSAVSEIHAVNSRWLMTEAFCLASEADELKPYEKHHSTVKDACRLAEKLNVKNLILYHTDDGNLKKRKKLYTAEGKKVFKGNLYVPDDLEVIEI